MSDNQDPTNQAPANQAPVREAPVSAGQPSSPGSLLDHFNADGELSDELELEPEVVAQTLPVGMKIDDRYEIMDVLGVGGFATVYRAHHLTIDRDVALKVMDLKKGVDASYSQRFFREAKIAAKIHHNNVVSIYDFGHIAETGQPYIAMEMLHGHDLSHELSKVGPLSPQRAYVLFRPVLDALGQGHRLGIVHKDLKPENLYLVDPGGQHELMKVLDFGVARINSSEVAKLTSAGQLLGTPRYLAPEYIKTQQVSPAIDVYQMALIISEALTGIPAVTGDPFHAMMLHCSGQIQFAEFLLEGPVGEVFRKAISIEPEQRYPDCDAFGAALDSIAEYFSSTVPLEGGAPQLTPSGGSADFTLPMSGGGMRTGTLDVSQSGLSVHADPPNRKPLIIVIALLIIGIVVVVIMLANKEEPQQIVVAPEVKEDQVFEFSFESEPTGALVLRNGKHILCAPTPCTATFTESELKYSQLVVFKLSGYENRDYELKENTYKNTNGKITVTLKKEEEKQDNEPKELKFTLSYSPENAKVTDNETNEVLCSSSPCDIVFNVENGYRKVRVSLKGYKSVDEMLSKKAFEDSGGNLSVTLEKQKEKAPKPQKQETPRPAPTAVDML